MIASEGRTHSVASKRISEIRAEPTLRETSNERFDDLAAPQSGKSDVICPMNRAVEIDAPLKESP